MSLIVWLLKGIAYLGSFSLIFIIPLYFINLFVKHYYAVKKRNK